ncbi:MAG: serine hydrolase domain-containing protein [Patescibacteria group bacterium]|nr:serine hydrolase domain-containing protein [Patescibacteria group bacterium]
MMCKHNITRRTFLATATRAGAATVLPALLHRAAPAANTQAGNAADTTTAAPESLAQVVEAGITEGYCRGAVVLVGTPEEVLLHKAFGHSRVEPEQVAMRKDSLFDLASVTKVVAATTACAACVDQGLVDLDRPLREYLPEMSGKGIEPVTLRQVGAHTSGLDNHKYSPRYRGDAMIRAMLAAAPCREPGSRYEYSCLNFILLGLVVEKVSGKPLDAFCQEHVYQPLGMTDTRFGPVPQSPRLVGNSVKEPGQISDAQARLAGRPVGNAGLFSTAPDLARFCRMMLNNGQAGDRRILSDTVIADMTRRSPAAVSARGFGWDLEPAGRPKALSDATYYHTGWTGQSMWIDPGSKRYVIVLTNRDHPRSIGSLYQGAKQFRARVADAALAACCHEEES